MLRTLSIACVFLPLYWLLAATSLSVQFTERNCDQFKIILRPLSLILYRIHLLRFIYSFL
jgi:hypothetical protein